MKFSNYYNPEGRHRKIYSRKRIMGMTLEELLERELELAYQYNTIGIPLDSELTQSPNAFEYTDEKGLPYWRAGIDEQKELEKQQASLAQPDAVTQQLQNNVKSVGLNPNKGLSGFGVQKQQEMMPMQEAEQTNGLLEGFGQIASAGMNALKKGKNTFPDLGKATQPTTDGIAPEGAGMKNYIVEPNNTNNIRNDYIPVQEGDLLKTVAIETDFKTPYDAEIDSNPNWTEEEKYAKKQEVYQIQQNAEARNREINRENILNQAKIYGKELLPYVIPGTLPVKLVGKTAKLLAPIVSKPLSKLGDKIKNKLSEDLAKSVIASPINSLIEAIDEKKNIAQIVLLNYPKDIAEGLLLGAYDSYNGKNKAKRYIEKKIAKWNTRQQRKQQERSTQYYDDYIKSTNEDIGIEKWLEELRKKRSR